MTRLETCPKCKWGILLKLARGLRRCVHCWHEWETKATPKPDVVTLLRPDWQEGVWQ